MPKLADCLDSVDVTRLANTLDSAADMQKYCSSFPNRFVFGMMTP